MREYNILKVGLFGIGLDAYWEQFQGLKERLEKYLSIVEHKLKNYQSQVVNLGLIDNPEKAIMAGHEFGKLHCCSLWKGPMVNYCFLLEKENLKKGQF